MSVDICALSVRVLLAYKPLIQELGSERVYQIISPAADEFPRIALYEEARQYTCFADDEPIEECIAVKVNIYARENKLSKLTSLVHKALSKEGFIRKSTGADNYLPGYGIFVKSIRYEKYIELE